MSGALKPAQETVSVSAEPVGADEFTALMRVSELPEKIALAVSGGPDSMALALCIKAWAADKKKSILAFIVDHGLRPESITEAETTRTRLKAIGIKPEILRWEHTPVVTRIHASARKARYRLLAEACRRHDIDTLFLAHQQEDQAETILMRFAKGSGVDGLAGMRAETTLDGVRLLRPFLSIPKPRLIATCRAAGLDFIDDVSNRAEKFARGRLRKVMPLLAEEGLTIERLVDLGARAAEAKEALDHYTQIFLRDASNRDDAGVIRIDLTQFRALPRAIAGRALTLALQNVHAEDYAPEYAPLMRLCDALYAADEMTPRTLHGCLVSKTETQITIMREFAAITDTPAIHPGESLVWDGRWQVTLTHNNSPPLEGGVRGGGVQQSSSSICKSKHEECVTPTHLASPARGEGLFYIRPLGQPPHEMLDELAPGLRKSVPQGRARAVLPALWQEDRLVLIPSLKDDKAPVQARLVSKWPKD